MAFVRRPPRPCQALAVLAEPGGPSRNFPFRCARCLRASGARPPWSSSGLQGWCPVPPCRRRPRPLSRPPRWGGPTDPVDCAAAPSSASRAVGASGLSVSVSPPRPRGPLLRLPLMGLSKCWRWSPSCTSVARCALRTPRRLPLHQLQLRATALSRARWPPRSWETGDVPPRDASIARPFAPSGAGLPSLPHQRSVLVVPPDLDGFTAHGPFVRRPPVGLGPVLGWSCLHDSPRRRSISPGVGAPPK